jgi:hypothetical protein
MTLILPYAYAYSVSGNLYPTSGILNVIITGTNPLATGLDYWKIWSADQSTNYPGSPIVFYRPGGCISSRFFAMIFVISIAKEIANQEKNDNE